MNAQSLPATQTLDTLAQKWGIEIDLTPLARQEIAFAEMLASAGKFDGSYEAAKARFDAARKLG